MMGVKEQGQYLAELGIRLKTLRLARNDTMAVFAQRLQVSAGTLRAMEHGTATVQTSSIKHTFEEVVKTTSGGA